jgi:hypothetical protein
MMLQTQVLSYGKHDEEIATLNQVFALIKAHYPGGYPLELHPTVTYVLKRLDDLMTTQAVTLRLYDQRASQ